jgi:predicted nuclease of predicted toxin-antitoxin system
MRFLVDACAGRTIADTLHGQGHEVAFVGAVDPKMKDEPILEWAVREQRAVVITDKDFEEMVYLQGKPHAGILRLANVRVPQRLALLQEALSRHGADLGPEVIVIAERGKIRVRRP